ncbi:hypothetical protein [Bordetella sp. N]|uniref:hypothetical protein n=1 Tax=Bordetella sp. N TaxID=1746199 RepID=UPI00070E1FE1|nr:hypothetical protein [Bordetella sp. N]ALM86513.1 hypothetical protein ASB57_29485 [Bordetella sp. N]
MLTDIVTRALSHLAGSELPNERLKGTFRYAYASDDGKYVAILTHDQTTYVVDLTEARYCAEGSGVPCGFSGHVLEMEGEAKTPRARPAYARVFDLDMDGDEIDWRQCPESFGRFRSGRVYS